MAPVIDVHTHMLTKDYVSLLERHGETIEQHRAGKLRIVAVTGETRTQSLPEVPTLKEQGISMTADAFFGLYGPAGLAPAYGNGDELAATQAAHLKRREAPIKASGFTAE